MNETEEKVNNHFQRSLVKTYEVLEDDGRKYYPVKQLQELNLALQSCSKNGIIISGQSGTGKTALVHTFVQQNLNEIFGLESIKVVKIKPLWLIVRPDIDKMFDQITSVIEELQATELIIYIDFNDSAAMKKAIDVISIYLDDIKAYYNMSFLKFIFECTKNKQEEYNELALSLDSKWYITTVVQKKSIDLLADRLIPRVDELSKLYEIEYTRDILMFYLALETSWNEDDNLNSYLDIIETAFLLAKKSGKKVLDKDIAKGIFQREFEYLDYTPKEAIKNTARHEAGHTLFRLIYNKKCDICFVSIVPGKNYRGVTVSDNSREVSSYYLNKTYYLNEIACVLAGRIAENTLDKSIEPNAGAGCDLRRAMSILNELIKSYGISNVLGDNYVLLNEDIISEETKAQIENEKRELLKKAEGIARDVVYKYSDFVEKLANRLCEDLVLVNHQIYEMWDDYCARNTKLANKKQG